MLLSHIQFSWVWVVNWLQYLCSAFYLLISKMFNIHAIDKDIKWLRVHSFIHSLLTNWSTKIKFYRFVTNRFVATKTTCKKFCIYSFSPLCSLFPVRCLILNINHNILNKLLFNVLKWSSYFTLYFLVLEVQ